MQNIILETCMIFRLFTLSKFLKEFNYIFHNFDLYCIPTSRNPTRNTRNPPGTPGTPPGTPGTPPGTPGTLPGTLPGTPGTLPGTPGTPPGTPGTPPGTPGTLPGTPGTLPGTPGTPPGTPGTPPGTPGTPPGTRWNTSYEATHVFLYKFTCFALNSGCWMVTIFNFTCIFVSLNNFSHGQG